MKNNIKLAAIITYITIIFTNATALIYTPFVLGTLGKSEYGIFSLVNSIIAYIYLLDMGFGNAVVRYNSKYIEEKDSKLRQKVNGMFLTLYLILGIVSLVIGLIIYININNFFGKNLNYHEISLTKAMFMVAIFNVAISFPLSIFNSIITAYEKFVYLKLLNLIRAVLNPVIMIAVLIGGYRALGMVIASTVLNLTLGLVNVTYCFKRLNLRIKFEGFDKRLFKEIFRYSFFVFLSSIGYLIYWNTDQFLLAAFVGSAPIAVYAIASQFNSYFITFSGVLSGMFLPKLTKMVVSKSDKQELMHLLIKVGRIQFFICSYIIMGFILIGKQFITRWVGNGYSLAYIIAIIFMVPQVFSNIQALFATMLEAMNKHRVKAFIYVFISAINLILSIILVQRFQGIGCAIGTAIGMIINAVANNIYYKYVIKLKIRYFWTEILKLFIPTGITFILGKVFVIIYDTTSYSSILIFVIFFSLIYLSIFYAIGFNSYEKNILKAVIRRGATAVQGICGKRREEIQ